MLLLLLLDFTNFRNWQKAGGGKWLLQISNDILHNTYFETVTARIQNENLPAVGVYYCKLLCDKC